MWNTHIACSQPTGKTGNMPADERASSPFHQTEIFFLWNRLEACS
ncbi:hypothetical protein QUA52_30260 [Microcoleus sp. N9_A3]